jgi:NADPH:quinone reductase-like Zn-dependent oxidoreductase
MITSGKFQCIIDSTFPLTQEGIEEAYGRLKSRRAVGKIIITMP